MESETYTAVLASRAAGRAKSLEKAALNLLRARTQWEIGSVDILEFDLDLDSSCDFIVVRTRGNGGTEYVPVEDADPKTLADVAKRVALK